jgi:hypothetical protein
MLVIILMVLQIIIYGNSVGLAIGIGSIFLLLQLYNKKNRIDAHACSWAPGLSYNSVMMSRLHSLVLQLRPCLVPKIFEEKLM